MDLMIDIETLGVKTKAPVISIGACFFDKTGIKQKFYAVLDMPQQIDSGLREVDASTIKWWMGQEGAAQKIFRDDVGVMIDESTCGFVHTVYFNETKNLLSKFTDFCSLYKNAKPWGNGPNFDITILESLLQDYDTVIPWNFRNIRDLRTFKEYVYDGSDTVREGTQHNALDDAVHQAQVVIDGLNKKNKEEEKEEIDTSPRYRPKPLPLKYSFSLFLADFKARMNK